MKLSPKNRLHAPGFIRVGRGFIFLIGFVIIIALSYFGTTWGREYYILKMGKTCSERMWLIETAKEKYRKKTGQKRGKVDTYAELLPFLPFTGFPMCPWGGEYQDKLDLDKKVSCPCNGKPEYEPKNSPEGTNLMFNGYNDLGTIPESIPLNDFLLEKAHLKKKEKGKEGEKKSPSSSVFK